MATRPRRAVRLDELLRSRRRRDVHAHTRADARAHGHDLRRVLRSRDHDIAASSLRVLRRPARRATDPRRRRELYNKQITGPIPTKIGLLTKLTFLRVPPRPRRPTRRATDPRRRRTLASNQITGPIPTEIGQLAALEYL